MAPRKAAAPGKALINYDEQLAALAKKAKKAESGVGLGQFVSFKAGEMSYLGSAIKDNTMNIVVLTHMLENAYYEGAYDDSNPTSPVCYAYSGLDEEDEDGSTMAPHEKSSQKQHETCSGCPQNIFGTANVGKGKACKNSRRLAFIVEGDLTSPEDVQNAAVAFAKLPVTSVKAWAGCVKSMVDNFERPPLCFVVEMSTVLTPKDKSPYKVKFDIVRQIEDTDPIIGALIARSKIVEADLRQPYIETEAAPERPARSGGRVAAKPNPAKAAAAKKFARGGR